MTNGLDDEEVERIETVDELAEALGVPQGIVEETALSGEVTLTHRGPDGEVKNKKTVDL